MGVFTCCVLSILRLTIILHAIKKGNCSFKCRILDCKTESDFRDVKVCGQGSA